MKLYVLPTEKSCDAHCSFCITDFRRMADKEFLTLDNLTAPFAILRPKKIEITGGGEPTLNLRINEIISYCSSKAPTIMYTHGAHLKRVKNTRDLSELCVSIAHYDATKNREIMGITPDFDRLREIRTPIKFSLMLHNSGISTKKEVFSYLKWAKEYAQRVVIRQLFDHDYHGKLNGEFVSSKKLFDDLGINDFTLTPQGNPLFKIGDLEVEVEYRSCSCEMDDPVLHADGMLCIGWSELLYDPYR